jgi:hypothetical protein
VDDESEVKGSMASSQERSEKAFPQKLAPVTFKSTLKNLLRNPTYLGTLVSLTNLYFIVTGMQYWATYYIINVL